MKNYRRITALILAVAMIASMFAFGSTIVSASELPESIVSIGESHTATYEAEWEEIVFGVGSDPAVQKGDLYYSLKFDSSKAEKANWFPVFGKTIDVSKYIPAKSGKTYIIGFILLTDLEIGKFENAKALTIPSRVAAPAKGQNKYDPKTGFTLADGAEVRFEIGSWVDKDTIEELSKKSVDEKIVNWFTVPENFPFGAKGEIRMAADLDKKQAASSSIKFKIPAQPKAPKIKVEKVGKETVKVGEENKEVDVIGLKGVKSTMEISVSKDFAESEVITATDKMKVAELKSKLFVGDNEGKIGENKKATVYIRTKATDKKPYSLIAEVTVDFSSVQETQSAE